MKKGFLLRWAMFPGERASVCVWCLCALGCGKGKIISRSPYYAGFMSEALYLGESLSITAGACPRLDKYTDTDTVFTSASGETVTHTYTQKKNSLSHSQSQVSISCTHNKQLRTVAKGKPIIHQCRCDVIFHRFYEGNTSQGLCNINL